MVETEGRAADPCGRSEAARVAEKGVGRGNQGGIFNPLCDLPLAPPSADWFIQVMLAHYRPIL